MNLRTAPHPKHRVHIDLPNGLYAVVTPAGWRAPFVAGFVVEDGTITDCAPILDRKLGMWATSPWVRKVGDDTKT